MKRCIAFTLAEVLITLGVIGVVAAMTLPTFGIINPAEASPICLRNCLRVLIMNALFVMFLFHHLA